MTAVPRPSGPDNDELRKALAEALRDWNRLPSPYAMLTRSQRLAVAEALAPFVTAHARRVAATELRAAADIPLNACCPEHASKRLRARAAALEEDR